MDWLTHRKLTLFSPFLCSIELVHLTYHGGKANTK